MTPDATLRAQLRRLLDEVIPPGLTEVDTRFTDAELDELLAAAADMNAAAAEGWFRKAARALSERGGVAEASSGSERMRFVSHETYREHCLEMARLYESRARDGGSRLWTVAEPVVLPPVQPGIGDASRLGGEW